jgi:hypothetical protein
VLGKQFYYSFFFFSSSLFLFIGELILVYLVWIFCGFLVNNESFHSKHLDFYFMEPEVEYKHLWVTISSEIRYVCVADLLDLTKNYLLWNCLMKVCPVISAIRNITFYIALRNFNWLQPFRCLVQNGAVPPWLNKLKSPFSLKPPNKNHSPDCSSQKCF